MARALPGGHDAGNAARHPTFARQYRGLEPDKRPRQKPVASPSALAGPGAKSATRLLKVRVLTCFPDIPRRLRGMDLWPCSCGPQRGQERNRASERGIRTVKYLYNLPDTGDLTPDCSTHPLFRDIP
jgi:hypothetical protein